MSTILSYALTHTDSHRYANISRGHTQVLKSLADARGLPPSAHRNAVLVLIAMQHHARKVGGMVLNTATESFIHDDTGIGKPAIKLSLELLVEAGIIEPCDQDLAVVRRRDVKPLAFRLNPETVQRAEATGKERAGFRALPTAVLPATGQQLPDSLPPVAMEEPDPGNCCPQSLLHSDQDTLHSPGDDPVIEDVADAAALGRLVGRRPELAARRFRSADVGLLDRLLRQLRYGAAFTPDWRKLGRRLELVCWTWGGIWHLVETIKAQAGRLHSPAGFLDYMLADPEEAMDMNARSLPQPPEIRQFSPQPAESRPLAGPDSLAQVAELQREHPEVMAELARDPRVARWQGMPIVQAANWLKLASERLVLTT